MIVQEIVGEWADGTKLIKTCSDAGHYVVNTDGDKYGEAIDPDFAHRTYTESEDYIDDDVEGTADEILNILFGEEERE